MPIDLYFPSLSGGVEQGLNDAGIETFEGDYQQHIIRECTQNALDARIDSDIPVKISIQLHALPAQVIPGLGSLRRSISAARDYWEGNEKTERYCHRALTWTESETVAVLEIADFGTKGLRGGDDDHRGSWFGLVRSGGVSINQDDAGGAFGIGKKAPFAGSFARTVFYSSLNQEGETAFQGNVTLTSHLDGAGKKTQGSGFIGDVDEESAECRSIRDADLIPESFRRTETGTSLFVIAYRDVAATDWTEIFLRHAIENFWPAIHNGILEFEFGANKLNSETLPRLMDRFGTQANFPSRFYYKAVTGEKCKVWTTELPHLGDCKLFLVPGDASFPKKVCMTRQTGMLIYHASRFRSYRPFAGLFTCASHSGNSYLRKLEPPRHDKWDAARGDNQAEAKRVIANIRKWINQCLRELNPDENIREADIPELSRYLPDEEEEPLDDDAVTAATGDGGEGIVTAPPVQALPIIEVPIRQPVRTNPGPKEVPGNGEEDGDGTGGGTPNPSDTPTKTPGGESDTTGGGSTDEPQLREVKHHLSIRSARSAENIYNLIIRSEAACAGKLRLVSIGEDNKEDGDLRIAEIRNVDTDQLLDTREISLTPNQPLRLRVVFDSSVPLSLRAYCHGN